MSGTTATSGSDHPAMRIATRGLEFLAALAVALPEAPLHRVAALLGAGWYIVAPRRRARARANLARICSFVAEQGSASPRVAAAARDPRALERMVRAAFQHDVRYYLEVLLAAKYDAAYFERHVTLRDPEAIEGYFGRGGALIVVGLHLGALELPGTYFSQVQRLPTTAPMESLDNVAIQRFLERMRGKSRIRLIPIAGSRAALTAALRRGEVAGLVADRDVSGSGVATPLFGAAAPLPVGPALLAVSTGAPAYAAAALRTGWGSYSARVIPMPTPAEGTMREKSIGFLAAQATAFEQLIAEAPDQWTAVFFRIWPDLDEVAG